jgi:predicted MFS family arabinose efflux permease
MSTLESIARRLFLFQLCLLLLGAAAIVTLASRVFEDDLEPEMVKKAETIAASLAGQLQRALGHGVPLERLRGVEELFATVVAGNDEVTFVATLTPAGAVLFRSGAGWAAAIDPVREALAAVPPGDGAGPPATARSIGALLVMRPVQQAGVTHAVVVVGVDRAYTQERLQEIVYDLLVVLVVSLLLTFEVLVIITSNVGEPLRLLRRVIGGLEEGRLDAVTLRHGGRETARIVEGVAVLLGWLRERSAGPATQATGPPAATRASPVLVRAPLFAFFFAEELSRSFFPLFVRSLETPTIALSPEIVLSLPMVLFMLIVALSQPFGGSLADRFGARRLMLVGAALGAAGLTLTATATALGPLLAWRALTALGYGLVFVAGQSYVIANTDASNRTWGMAMFVGAVLAASICGPSIGGILAERVGYRATFVTGAVLAIGSGVLAARLLSPMAPGAATAKPLRFADLGVVLASPRFIGLVLLGAVPAKVVLTGFLYFLAPLQLEAEGASQSAIGRIMMLYGLAMVLLTPLTAKLADRWKAHLACIVIGGVLSGAGLMGLRWFDGIEVMVVAILVLGIAQAISVTPQLTLVPIVCRAECAQIGQGSVMGFFRLFERLGSAAGPAIAAALLGGLGFTGACIAIAAMLIVASAALLLGRGLVTGRAPALAPA